MPSVTNQIGKIWILTLVFIYQTTWHHTPRDSNLQSQVILSPPNSIHEHFTIYMLFNDTVPTVELTMHRIKRTIIILLCHLFNNTANIKTIWCQVWLSLTANLKRSEKATVTYFINFAYKWGKSWKIEVMMAVFESHTGMSGFISSVSHTKWFLGPLPNRTADLFQ
jgi:hypothetical protein